MGSTGRHGGWTTLDPAVPDLTRQLTEALRAASDQAGRPSFRELRARSVRSGAALVLTPTTLHRIFTPNPGRAGGASLPEWVYYETLLGLLGAEPGDYLERWEAAQQEWRNRTPAEASTEPQPESAAGPVAGEPPRPRRRWRVLTPLSVALGLIALVVMGSAIGVVLTQFPGRQSTATPAQQAEQQHRPQPDGSDPNATGCADTARLTTFYSHLYPHWPVQTGPHSAAVVTLDYSPACRTVWLVLRDAKPGATATLYRTGADPATLTCRAGPDGSCSTAQLNDVRAHSYGTARSEQYYARTRTI
ncbi:DUF2690 domain-containing protein [Sciscionella marina]|uniref:DUF2690 domain-containing protein n=1 Tax=Sciscionella marina TaxID=508770 RepID=UPI000373B040|nr:DUF2690 domain-containing protein [Sciscionella marina]